MRRQRRQERRRAITRKAVARAEEDRALSDVVEENEALEELARVYGFPSTGVRDLAAYAVDPEAGNSGGFMQVPVAGVPRDDDWPYDDYPPDPL